MGLHRAEQATPDRIVSQIEQHGRVRALLDQLSLRQREALILRYFEGLSIQETAQTMGCAEGTVKATVAQALRRLRQQWTDR